MQVRPRKNKSKYISAARLVGLQLLFEGFVLPHHVPSALVFNCIN